MRVPDEAQRSCADDYPYDALRLLQARKESEGVRWTETQSELWAQILCEVAPEFGRQVSEAVVREYSGVKLMPAHWLETARAMQRPPAARREELKRFDGGRLQARQLMLVGAGGYLPAHICREMENITALEERVTELKEQITELEEEISVAIDISDEIAASKETNDRIAASLPATG